MPIFLLFEGQGRTIGSEATHKNNSLTVMLIINLLLISVKKKHKQQVEVYYEVKRQRPHTVIQEG